MADNSIPLKQCSRKEQCISPLGSWQPATTEYFRKASKEKSGLTSRCKSCLHKGDAKYRGENPDHHKEWYEDQKRKNPDFVKEIYQKNKPAIIARVLQWQKDFPEKANAKSKRSYQLHKDDKLAKQQEYYRANPHIKRAHGKKYRDTHKEQIKKSSEEYNKAHPDIRRSIQATRRARIVGAGGKFSQADVDRLYTKQNGKCAYCGRELNGKFHIDHIQPLARGGTNWPDNLNCSCADCNLSKGDKTLEEWMTTRGW